MAFYIWLIERAHDWLASTPRKTAETTGLSRTYEWTPQLKVPVDTATAAGPEMSGHHPSPETVKTKRFDQQRERGRRLPYGVHDRRPPPRPWRHSLEF
jgi:hypothetical protein